jgi:hypothetical protein
MRPYATLGLLLSLAACSVIDEGIGSVIGNPTDGLLDFVGDTVSFKSNPNRPEPESDTIRRAMGQDVQSDALVSETGNIWPTMPRQEPTMQELQRAPTPTPPAAAAQPAPSPAIASTPPAPVVLPTQPVVTAPPAPVASSRIASAGITSGTALPTPNGHAILTADHNGIMSYTLPSGASGRAIDNGNGTMTLIGTDGQVMSVPAPR